MKIIPVAGPSITKEINYKCNKNGWYEMHY